MLPRTCRPCLSFLCLKFAAPGRRGARYRASFPRVRAEKPDEDCLGDPLAHTGYRATRYRAG